MQRVKAILFDFDGTLFELKVDWDQVRSDLKSFFKTYNLTSNFKPLRSCVQELTQILMAKGLSTSQVEEVEKQAYGIISKHEIEGAEEGYPREGAKEILEWCQEQGIKVVILTRNTKDCVFPVLKKYGWPQPDLIIAREDVQKEKPDPEAGLLVLEKLNLRVENCLVVGDSRPDLEMAKNLGIKSVLYHNPRHQLIPKDQADFFIRNLLELKDIVANFW